MWLPFTRRSDLARGSFTCSARNCPAHGPAALTSARAATTRSSPVASLRTRTVHRFASRAASTQRHRVRMVAPRSAASIAFSTTSRASSTQPSAYSKPRV